MIALAGSTRSTPAVLLPLQIEAGVMRRIKCTYTKHHFQHIPCVKHAQQAARCLEVLACNVYNSSRQSVRDSQSLLHCFDKLLEQLCFWLVMQNFRSCFCSGFALLVAPWEEPVLWLLVWSSVLAFLCPVSVWFAPGCVGWLVNCCCLLCLLACHSCANLNAHLVGSCLCLCRRFSQLL